MSTRSEIVAIVRQVAPNAAIEQLRGDEDLRDQLDLDSMDFLNILVAIAEQLHVEIPERDYPKVRTLDALVAYVDGGPSKGRDRP
ncbi:acyl carrier protein [Nannocystaceae bacterium ST9]